MNRIITWKEDLLTVNTFKQERPNMGSISDEDIQASINASLALLNAECNGLIEKVWFILNPESEFFRTDIERNYIVEAAISQVQFTINLGNDFTDGSSSFSMGGINGSYQRPIDKKNIAPGVYVLLQKARVYQLQSFSKTITTPIHTGANWETPLTISTGDSRYISRFQEGTGNPQGAVLAIDGDIATFKQPKDLNWSMIDSMRIWDNGYGGTGFNPIDTFGEFVSINNVRNLAWLGKNANNVFTRAEVYNLITSFNTLWNATTSYSKGVVVDYEFVGEAGKLFLGKAVSLIDNNIGNNPADQTKLNRPWNIATPAIDIDVIVEETVSIIEPQLPPLIDEAMNKLETIDYKSEYEGQTLMFNNEAEFNIFKEKSNTNDSYYENVDIDYANNADLDKVKEDIEINKTDIQNIKSNVQYKGYYRQVFMPYKKNDIVIEQTTDKLFMSMIDNNTEPLTSPWAWGPLGLMSGRGGASTLTKCRLILHEEIYNMETSGNTIGEEVGSIHPINKTLEEDCEYVLEVQFSMIDISTGFMELLTNSEMTINRKILTGNVFMLSPNVIKNLIEPGVVEDLVLVWVSLTEQSFKYLNAAWLSYGGVGKELIRLVKATLYKKEWY